MRPRKPPLNPNNKSNPGNRVKGQSFERPGRNQVLRGNTPAPIATEGPMDPQPDQDTSNAMPMPPAAGAGKKVFGKAKKGAFPKKPSPLYGEY